MGRKIDLTGFGGQRRRVKKWRQNLHVQLFAQDLLQRGAEKCCSRCGERDTHQYLKKESRACLSAEGTDPVLRKEEEMGPNAK